MILQSNHIILFALAPIIGLILSYQISSRFTSKTALFFGIITLPIFTGYDYTIDWLYEFNITVLLALAYCTLIKKASGNWTRISSSIGLSFFLFIPLAFIAFVDAFAGGQYIEKTWHKQSYTINYVRDQGFSGQVAFYYELIHCPVYGLFQKRLTKHHKQLDECNISFLAQNINVNICKK